MLREMGLTLIVGPPNSGRAGEVLSRLRACADREPVLVVRSSADVNRFEDELCAGGGAALGISLRTFDWLFADLAEAYGVHTGLPLSSPERLALIRVVAGRAGLRVLARSAQRPGFAPALDALISELGAALIQPGDLAAAAAELDDGAAEAEIARLYSTYAELRDRTGRGDRGTLHRAVLTAVEAEPARFGARPVFVYGFDDLSVAQRELLRALKGAGEVTVAVNFADRVALAARAGMLADLRAELEPGSEITLEEAPEHSASRTLVHLDRHLFEAGAATVEPDDGLALMESAGERGEADAIAIEAGRLVAAGASPQDIVVTLRDPAADGPLLASVLEEHGLPVALDARIPLRQTGTGFALLALCRAVAPLSTPADLLAHMRCDPSIPPGAVDWLERRVRRGELTTVEAMAASWERPPRSFARVRDASGPLARLSALANAARDIAEGAHRKAAPLAGSTSAGPAPVVALELRAGAAAAELLSELATVGEMEGVGVPSLDDAVAAIEGASVPAWRGPAEGRIRIVSPYGVRGIRARYLFCAALGDGRFPSRGAIDPLLGPERRAALGFAALRRREPADEERFLFHACVSRPRERLYLSWRSSDEDGSALARSPFVDEVLDLLAPDPDSAERARKRVRGPENVVVATADTTTERERRRAAAAATSVPERKPRGLRNDLVRATIAGRDGVSANSLEGWIGCSYRWFVDHELRPERLEPKADPLWLGSVVHGALERLYRDPPGDDTIPRPGDLGRWKARLNELLDEIAGGDVVGVERRSAMARVRAQVEAFLAAEAASETNLRPRGDMLEWSFGLEDDEREPFVAGELRLHGVVDRVDVGPDGRSAVIRDYKTSKTVYGAKAWEGRGLLQLPLYMRAVREIGELDPIAGLYHPLAAYSVKGRRPRGIAQKGDERMRGFDLVNTDRLDEEGFEPAIDAAVQRATEAARAMLGGEIDRDPLKGRCPKYCRYQPICRIERAIGLDESDSEDDEE